MHSIFRILLSRNAHVRIDNLAHRYVVGTGWWCDESRTHGGTKFNQSADLTRSPEFYNIWLKTVEQYLNPEKIIVVDSASPILPKLNENSNTQVQFLSLTHNFGHYATCKLGKMCGVERVHLLCALYAYCNDCDLVYIEQDCLVIGQGWIEECYAAWRKKKIMYGDGKGTRQPQQQSLVLVAHRFIPVFIDRLIRSGDRAHEALLNGEPRGRHSPEKRWHSAFERDVDYIPFGYGRRRPLNFCDPHMYAQHWTAEEFRKVLRREQIDWK